MHPSAGSARLLADAAATEALGARIALGVPRALVRRAFDAALVIALEGPLGAGKTTLVRGLVRALGGTGPVRSPTYTLVEPHRTASIDVNHFDLYRLADPEELELIGAREYFRGDALCAVEWPERGRGILPSPDLRVALDFSDSMREARIESTGEAGAVLLEAAWSEGN